MRHLPKLPRKTGPIIACAGAILFCFGRAFGQDPAEADEVSYDQSTSITKALSASFDYVVVDTCAGLDPHALSVSDMSTDLVFVCSSTYRASGPCVVNSMRSIDLA